MEVCVALRHVFNTLDTQNQWKRAVDALRGMTELERAQAWKLFSADNLKLESPGALIVHSQYKALFKAAVREAAKCEIFVDVPLHCDTDDTTELLREYRARLDEFAELLAGFSYFYRKDSPDNDTDTPAVTDPNHNAQTVIYHAHTRDHISLSDVLSELRKTGNEQNKKISELLEIVQTGKRPESAPQSTLSGLGSQIGQIQTTLDQHELSLNELTKSIRRVTLLAERIPDDETRSIEKLQLTKSIDDLLANMAAQHEVQEEQYHNFKEQAAAITKQHEEFLQLKTELHSELSGQNSQIIGKIQDLAQGVVMTARVVSDLSRTVSDSNTVVSGHLESLHQQYDSVQSEMKAKFDGSDNTHTGEDQKKKMEELYQNVLDAKKQSDLLNIQTRQEILAIKRTTNNNVTHISHLAQRLMPGAKIQPPLESFSIDSTVDETPYSSTKSSISKLENTKVPS
jgi:hypothetical protein